MRIPVIAMLVFGLGVLLASLRHAALFTLGAPATWLWFGGFGLATIVLALFTAVFLATGAVDGRDWSGKAYRQKETIMAVLASSTPSEADARSETPIWWPLRVWMGVEVLFGLASIVTIFLRPQDTATNFAWPIKPEVMAATLGSFYLASAIIFVLPLFARNWESVRPMIIPTAIFSTMMLLATIVHWSKFSVGRNAFYVWLASYVLPPPIFAVLYWWHQRRAAPVGRDRHQPIARWAQRFLRMNGLILAGLALLLFVFPALMQRFGPWDITPLAGRALCGWLIGVGLLRSLARLGRRLAAYEAFEHNADPPAMSRS